MKSQKKCKLIVFVFICSFFATNLDAQVRIGDTNPPNEQAVLELLSGVEAGGTTGAKGLLLPRVRLVAATNPSPFSHTPGSATDSLYVGMEVYNLGQAASSLAPGVYFWSGKEWVAAGVTTFWFYMPSTTFDMTKDATPHVKNLYNVYAQQFTLPVVGERSRADAPPIFLTLGAPTDFDYYIIGHSEDLFESVSIDENGVMTYKIDDDFIVDDETYINIVFVKKYQ
jgi:hypothetical protein